MHIPYPILREKENQRLKSEWNGDMDSLGNEVVNQQHLVHVIRS